MTRSSKAEQTILEEAASWAVAQSEGRMSRADARRFEAWLARSDRHRTLYGEVAELWGGDLLPEALMELRGESRSRQRWFTWLTVDMPRLRAAPALAATLVIAVTVWLAVVAASLMPFGAPAEMAHDTAYAEVREIALPDGSTVTLGAKSRMSVAFDDSERSVSLLAGEAFFSVVHDADRPFFVNAGDARVRVLGTEFEVRREPDGEQITVAEGVVEVAHMPDQPVSAPLSAAPWRTTITDGERVELSERAPEPEVTQVAADVPGAWRDGRLIYNDTPLRTVMADAQRYYQGDITIASPQLAELRISATFRSDDIPEMVDLLCRTMPVTAEHGRGGAIVLRSSQTG